MTISLQLSTFLFCQQPQTSTAPVFAANAQYVQGVGPGYWPTPGTGLTLHLAAGTAFCRGAVVNYSGGTLTLTADATHYVFLDGPNNCPPASNTSGFPVGSVPIGTVVTGASTITSVTDVRGWFANANPVVDYGGQVYNVKAYGAKGDGTTADSAAIQAAIDAASTAGGGTVLIPEGHYSLGTTTLQMKTNVRLLGAGPFATRLEYAGSAAAVKFTGPASRAFLGSLGIHLGTSATAIGIHLLAPEGTGQSVVLNGLRDLCVVTDSITAGQQGLRLEGVTDGQVVFNTFDAFEITAVDKPIVSTATTEGNLFSNFIVRSYGSGSTGQGVNESGQRDQFWNFWFGRGESTATTLYGFLFPEGSGGNIAWGVADVGTGSLYQDNGTSSSPNFIYGSYASPSTFGDSAPGASYKLEWGRGKGSSGYEVSAMSKTGANRNVFQTGVGGFSNGFSVDYQETGPQALRYSFLDGPVGIGVTPAFGGTSLTVNGPIASAVHVVSFSSTPTFNAALGNTQKITLTGNVTSSTLSNATAGEQIHFLICQDSSGNHTFAWPSNVKGGMTIGSTASTCSAQSFIFDGSNAYAVSPGVANM